MATKKQIREYAEANGITREQARKHFIDEAIKRNQEKLLNVLAIRHMSNGQKEMAFLGFNKESVLKDFEDFKKNFYHNGAAMNLRYKDINDEKLHADVRNQMLGFITQERWNHCENHGFIISAYALTTNSYENCKHMIDDDKCFVINFYEAQNSCRECGITTIDDAINQIEIYNKTSLVDVKVH